MGTLCMTFFDVVGETGDRVLELENEYCKSNDGHFDLNVPVMKAFSERHPDRVFCVGGQGDDGSPWQSYIKNGTEQNCAIKFDGYDPNKLTPM